MGNCLPSLFGARPRHDDTAPLQHRGVLDESGSSPSASSDRQDISLSTSHSAVLPSNHAPVVRQPASDRHADDARFEEETRIARKLGLLDQLPVDIYVDGGKTDKECAICMVEFDEGDRIRFLPCLHSYHVNCVDDWLLRSFTCPSCLEPVDSALLSSFTAHNCTDLASLAVSPARVGPVGKGNEG